MTSEIIKRMFDACYQAKRTRDMLPPLPEGVRASFIQYLDVIQSLSQKYDEQYFDSLLPYMEEIPDEDAECMIQTIEKFYQIMCERRKHYDER